MVERLELPDVTLADQDTGMMDTLCQPELVDTSLQSSLQEIFDLERQDVIEFHAGLVQHPDPNETANEGISFKQSLRVFLIECQKLTSRLMSATVNHIRALVGEGRRSYRAARRILDSVSMTRHTSRLLRRPYSPTIFNSASLMVQVSGMSTT